MTITYSLELIQSLTDEIRQRLRTAKLHDYTLNYHEIHGPRITGTHENHIARITPSYWRTRDKNNHQWELQLNTTQPPYSPTTIPIDWHTTDIDQILDVFVNHLLTAPKRNHEPTKRARNNTNRT